MRRSTTVVEAWPGFDREVGAVTQSPIYRLFTGRVRTPRKAIHNKPIVRGSWRWMSSHRSHDQQFGPLIATVVTYDDAPDECTIHPKTVPDGQRTTAWISAKEGSFFSLVEYR